MTEALYGADGFYRGARVPSAHFRTSAHIGTGLADALLTLAARVDAQLGEPTAFEICDIGAGGGELLAAMYERAGRVVPRLAPRLRLIGIDIAASSPDLPADIEWLTEVPTVTGLLIANEWLDNVPLDIAVTPGGSVQLLQVDGAGNERPGPPIGRLDRAWLDTWGPAGASRAEIGRTRDTAWSLAVSRVTRGAALAIDYAGDGTASLTGFRLGRELPAVPDGTCDLTAHVVFASVAAAGAAVASSEPLLLTQRDALLALGLDMRRPPETLAADDPRAYVAALAALSRHAALVDPAGLGGFRWLLQPVGISSPLDHGQH